MQPHRILLSWIGYADFRALAATLPPHPQAEVLKGLNPPTPLVGQAGPLKCLLDQERFDEVHLLTSHSGVRNRLYARWIGGQPVLHPVKVHDPTDYAEIFGVVDAQLASVVCLPRTDRQELCVHLSPGTPAMAAIWLLLGKSKYQRHYLRRAMEEANGVRRRAAALLGYRNYQTLAAQLERLGIR